eukprot:m.131210 g.131210  ORF g.131210 m.131210 type:complete len:221 (+) comp29529_c0_seq2:54-716(+)
MSDSELPPWVAVVVQVLATITTITLFLNGLKILRPLQVKGSVGEVSFVPFVAQVVNCTMWLKYGILLGDPTMILVNSVGEVAGFYYVYTYACIAGNTPNVTRTFGLGVVIIYGVLAMSWMIGDYKDTVNFVGLVASVFSVVMFGSPLVQLMKVLKSQSMVSMDFKQSLYSALCAGSWTVYGFILQDSFVKIPNLMGFTLGMIQLLLFGVFPRTRPLSGLP